MRRATTYKEKETNDGGEVWKLEGGVKFFFVWLTTK